MHSYSFLYLWEPYSKQQDLYKVQSFSSNVFVDTVKKIDPYSLDVYYNHI